VKNFLNLNLSCKSVSIIAAAVIMVSASSAYAWTSKDGTLEAHGYVDNTTHERLGQRAGLSKMRNRGQLEFSKYFKPVGPFSEISLHGVLRASYDAVYDLNDDEYGDKSGGAVNLQSLGGAALGAPTSVPWGATANPLLGPVVLPGTNPFASGTSPFLNGFFQGPNGGTNPNEGLVILGSESFKASGGVGAFGGIQLAYPTRPCNVDSRGCISGYMDADEDDLRYPEFNDRQDWLRELYIDATVPFDNGHELNLRIGRQQVVWGRTDLFRVLDQVNPIDFSIQNIYEEFEDSRIPMGMISAEYRVGATGAFDDMNLQFIWKFEEFRPHILGQGGQPYSILDAGNLFRGLATCWHNGCTVGNFAPNFTFGLTLPAPLGPFVAGTAPPVPGNIGSTGSLATTFPAHVLGIRQAFVPDDLDEFGFRLEGVLKGVGFSFNGLAFYQQLPSLHGGSSGPPAVNPFLCDPAATASVPPGPPAGVVCAGLQGAANAFGDPADAYLAEMPRDSLIAFDIHFPRVFLLGASADVYVEPLKSSFRFEVAHTTGEEFPNTLRPALFSESDVVRWVVGWDRPTFIKVLNPKRAFLISAQLFGQHLLDHEEIQTPLGKAGMPDWENNILATLLIQGFYMNDRLNPRIITAHDTKAGAWVVSPGIDWLISDNWRLVVGANFKFGTAKNEFDDCRACNQFPPFTDPTGGPAGAPLAPGPLPIGQAVNRIGGMAPLGAFRSGPIGMAQDEDELQILLRYRF
jgi:Protein of unknown function (DUF1302)